MTKIHVNSDVFQVWLDFHNYSQRAFGREYGMSSGYMSQILSGKRHVGPNTRKKLQEATRLPFDELFSRTEA